MHPLSAAAAALAFLALTAPSQAQTPDPNVYYKLSTQFRGPGMPLDVYPGGAKNNEVHLDKNQNVSGQNWHIVPAHKGAYRLTTQFRGPGLCLDITPSTNRPKLNPCGNYSGQFWKIVPTGKWVHLTTEFRGPGLCLDIDPPTNEPVLRPCGNLTGQFWMLSRTAVKAR